MTRQNEVLMRRRCRWIFFQKFMFSGCRATKFTIETIRQRCCITAEASFPQSSDMGMPAFSSYYYASVDGEADWNLADRNAAGKPLDLTVLERKFTELQSSCRRADDSVPSFSMELVYFTLMRVSAPLARGTMFSRLW